MANNQLLASDNWVSGSLAAAWSAYHGLSMCKVVSGTPNVVEPNTTSVQAGQIWTALTWPNDQISEVTANVQDGGGESSYLLLLARWQSGAASGYQANIFQNSGVPEAAIYVFTAGVSTLLGSVVTGLTFASGDVWTFEAAGACLSLYQNGNRITYYYDPTYTSGYPGFSQYTTGIVAHTQAFSWRGYSCVQQDGLWTKQGIVIAANATDLTADGNLVFGAYQNSAIIQQGALYTMLFSSGVGTTGAGGNGNIYFASSSDGKTWTRSGSPVIANYVNPSLWFDGTTYHCYCQSISAVQSNIAHFTSPDMTATSTWTRQSTNVLAPAAGQWDNSIFLLAPVAIISGTWYALYTGVASLSTQFKIGLATSPDGATWTKHVGNPVLTAANGGAVVGSQAVIEIDGLWHAWFYGCQPGQGNAASPLQDPFEAVRYVTADFVNWQLQSHSEHRSEQFESVNANTGGVAPCAVLSTGNAVYLYGIHCPSDAIGPQIYQVGMSIASAPIASFVAFNEDGIQQLAFDNFTSGAGSLSAAWTTPTGGTALKIVSGPYVEPTATSTFCSAVYTRTTFSPNQYSEVTIHTLSGTLAQSVIYPMVLASTAALTDYEGWISSPTATSDAAAGIYKRVAGTATQLGPTITVEPNVGDTWRLSVVTASDGFPVLSLFQNGFLILQVQDESSSPITSGSPGIAALSSVAIADAQISFWDGGNANVTPTYEGTLFSENFRTQANVDPLPLPWVSDLDTGVIGSLCIMNGSCQCDAGAVVLGQGDAWWSGYAPNDGWIQITIGNLDTSGEAIVFYRNSPANNYNTANTTTSYTASVFYAPPWKVKLVNQASSVVYSVAISLPKRGDVWTFTFAGINHAAYLNGEPIASGTDTETFTGGNGTAGIALVTSNVAGDATLLGFGIGAGTPPLSGGGSAAPFLLLGAGSA